MENTSGLHPTGRTVLVLLDEVPTSYGSVALAEETINKDRLAQIRATLVEVGPIAWQKDKAQFSPEQMASLKVPVGTRVIIRRYAGELVTGFDGVSYRIVNDEDIWARVAPNVATADLKLASG